MIEPSQVDPFSLPSLSLLERNKLPKCGAVYFLIDRDKNILYIGKSLNVCHRWKSHKLLTLLRLNNSEYTIAWYECADTNNLREIEVSLIKLFTPKLNVNHTGRSEERINKSSKVRVMARVDSQTPELVKNKAIALGYSGTKADCIGKLLDGIAKKEVLVVCFKK